MPKKISIKTVDGNRYECDHKDVDAWNDNGWLRIKDGSTIRIFWLNNIVYITVREEE